MCWLSKSTATDRSAVWQIAAHARELMLACFVQDAFLETVSFAVLRLLVDACMALDEKDYSVDKIILMTHVLNAVKYVCDHRHFRSLSGDDRSEAGCWLQDLSSSYRRMRQVQIKKPRSQGLALPSEKLHEAGPLLHHLIVWAAALRLCCLCMTET